MLSGNAKEHVLKVIKNNTFDRDGCLVYCDYGNTCLHRDDSSSMISNKYIIESKLLQKIISVPEFRDKAKIRGGVILTIKPLENRIYYKLIIDRILKQFNDKYCSKIAGHTSIDIVKKDFSKKSMLSLIMKTNDIFEEDAYYLGNEIDQGNEECIKEMNIRYLQINDLFETNSFLKVFHYLLSEKSAT